MGSGVIVQGVHVPALLYGTAWKEDATTEVTSAALHAGFRGVDTANQRKHYHEAAVGLALRPWFQTHARDSLFLQTKFTYLRGQDERLPYDPNANFSTQVAQSHASSLEHLSVEYLDAYLLHGPEREVGLSPGDWEVWRAMEALHDAGKVRLLGVSNVSAEQLSALCAGARIAPAIVQNRCYAVRAFDLAVREICSARGMVYEGFSLLTANRAFWGHESVKDIALRSGQTPAQVIFNFALHLGIVPLTGTTDPRHMREDLACQDLRLAPDDVRRLKALLGR